MKKIALDCQKCGGVLEISEDMEIFRCKYCDTPYMVERSGDNIKIVRLEQRVSEIEEKHGKLDSGVAKLEIKAIEEEKELFLDEWRKKQAPLVVPFTLALLLGMCVFTVNDSDLQFSLKFLIYCGYSVLIFTIFILVWLPKYKKVRKQELEIEKKLDSAQKRADKAN